MVWSGFAACFQYDSLSFLWSNSINLVADEKDFHGDNLVQMFGFTLMGKSETVLEYDSIM